MSLHAPPTKHVWKFFRTGGLDQVALESAEDLLALRELDQKLWVALSCPVKGLELDEQTLALVDADGDGHVHVREVIAAVEWAAAHLKKPAEILSPAGALPLEAINDLIPEGRTIVNSARRILASLGKKDATAIAVDDTADIGKILAARAPNGDGVVTLRAADDPDTLALIKDIIATVGGVTAPDGGEGVNAEKVDAFFKEAEAYVKWLDATAEKNIPQLGDSTGAACVAMRAVHAKIDDYFARCRLAAFDGRAIGALNRQETEFLAIAAKDLTITSEEVARFPLARVDAAGNLPLLEAVNPAWADWLARLHRLVVVPLLGRDRTHLTERDWSDLVTAFAPYEAWMANKPPAAIEKLGAARTKAILNGNARKRLMELIEEDKKLGADYNAMSSVAKLARYYRDLATLLRNFVNFAVFYASKGEATFQAGELYFDSRATNLCVRVDDIGAHAGLAVMSKTYVLYVECVRKSGEKMNVAACVTDGDSDYLFVGRNGLFYDRKGRDWDARVVKIIENPISLHEAFWAPYKKFLRMIEEQIAKRAATAESAKTASLTSVATTAANVGAPPATAAPPAPPPAVPPKKLDLSSIIGISVAIGSIGTFLSMVFTKFVDMPAWEVPLVIIAIMLVISLPSVVITWLKLRHRTIGPLLEANGWAINGRVKVNIPFGTKLTERGLLPKNAKRLMHDPYADNSAAWTAWTVGILIVLLAAATGAAWYLKTWPFKPATDIQATPAKNTAPSKK
jgi:hypothetical protein